MLGTVYHASGEVSEAVNNYRKAIDLGADAAAHTNLGVLLYAEERYEEAREAFEQAALLKPSSPAKQGNLGDAYRKLGRELDAVAAYGRAATLAREQLRINPKDPWTLASLAMYEAKLGRRDQAVRLAEEAAGFGPEMAGVVYRRAVVLALFGEIDQSLEVLADALRKGYSRHLASADEDLQPLHELPGFQELIADSVPTTSEGESI